MLFHGSEVVRKTELKKIQMDTCESVVVKKRRKVVDENFCEVIEEKELDGVSID